MKNWQTVFQISDNQFKAISRTYFSRPDTLPNVIHSPFFSVWNSQNAKASYSMKWDEKIDFFFEKNQTELFDSIVENKNCKILKSNLTRISVNQEENDSTNYSFQQIDIYAENIGLYKRYYITKEMETHSQLVEQFSMDEFNRRANHGKKRMAYIDPKKTMDDHSAFELCYPEIEIGDYYNCEQVAQLSGGKGSWWRILEKELNPELLFNESGYLTFRFVINCKGETGRFITEESDLDFVKKEFNEKTIQHFYEIISQQTDWKACEGMYRKKQDTQDAYTYITFKLKDGHVIEILP